MNTENFVKESNKIEGILRDPTRDEIIVHDYLMDQDVVTIDVLKAFVNVYQPDARLRDRFGLDVVVGNHAPPNGGLNIPILLKDLLETVEDKTPYQIHVEYETLHPFIDGNGRSGRALWAWHMLQTTGQYKLGFLHHFYYQSLSDRR